VPSVGVLIFFAIVGAFICAKARVAGGAVVFALVALVLFVTTPVGAGLPSAISDFISAVDHAATSALDGADGRAVG
jgi:hypothetical protein